MNRGTAMPAPRRLVVGEPLSTAHRSACALGRTTTPRASRARDLVEVDEFVVEGDDVDHGGQLVEARPSSVGSPTTTASRVGDRRVVAATSRGP